MTTGRKRNPLPTVFISRKDAITQGLKHYLIEKPCPKGHVAARIVGGGGAPR
jgi:hypothetical protein